MLLNGPLHIFFFAVSNLKKKDLPDYAQRIFPKVPEVSTS